MKKPNYTLVKFAFVHPFCLICLEPTSCTDNDFFPSVKHLYLTDNIMNLNLSHIAQTNELVKFLQLPIHKDIVAHGTNTFCSHIIRVPSSLGFSNIGVAMSCFGSLCHYYHSTSGQQSGSESPQPSFALLAGHSP